MWNVPAFLLSVLAVWISNTINNRLDEFSSLAAKHYHDVIYISYENRLDKPVFLQFGTAKRGQNGFTEPKRIEPGHVLYERVQTELRTASSERNCALISKQESFDDSNTEKVFIIVASPREDCMNKVFRIFKDKVIESCDPPDKHWHLGTIQVYQDGS